MPDPYSRLIESIASHPGSTVSDLADLLDADEETVEALCERALAKDDVVCFDDKYWVMRTGEYAFAEYPHNVSSDSKS